MNQNDCLHATLENLRKWVGISYYPNTIRQNILNMYDVNIRVFMAPEILGDTQISFQDFCKYFQKMNPGYKLICFVRLLVPFNERINGERYTVIKITLNESTSNKARDDEYFNTLSNHVKFLQSSIMYNDDGAQLIPNTYVVLTTDKNATGAGHYKAIQEKDEAKLIKKLTYED
jgi:hypothetical protein